MRIKPLTEQRKKEITTLSRKKGRQIHGQLLIEGLRSVESAVLAGAPVREVLVSNRVLEDAGVPNFLQASAVSIYSISEKAARQISTVETHQGVMAVADAVLQPMDNFQKMRMVLALDGVQDPGNVGTIIRTAAWFGIDGVIAGSGTADFFNPKVVRATMGGLWDVALTSAADLPAVIAGLKSHGAQAVAADLDGTALANWEPADQTVLVIGGEARGVSKEVREVIDESVTIPGGNGQLGVESLNAAMAAGILMHQLAAKGGKRVK